MPPVTTGAALVTAAGSAPPYCLVTGTVVTNPRTGKTASFGAALPLHWNGRLLFTGCGGLCGVVFEAPPDDPRGGGFPPDALERGYAIVATDDGHASNPPGVVFDGSWALKARGVPDEDAVTDYFYRAVHTVMAASRQLVQAWYAGAIRHAYFFGCSDGGREAMVEAARYPDDFDGVVAGAPLFDLPGQILAGRASTVLLDAPDAFVPRELLARVNDAVYASCDAADGLADGLIQSPGRCSFRPEALQCPGGRGPDCLTPAQVATLRAWFSAATDSEGRVLSFGFPVSDAYRHLAQGANLFAWAEGAGRPLDLDAGEPWGPDLQQQPPAWALWDQALKYLVFLDPAFDANRGSPVDSRGVVAGAAVAPLEESTRAGRGDDPGALGRFVASGRKLLLYHGYSDGFSSPFRTVRFYEDWARIAGGYPSLARSARLFMVPGMYHCNGGPGPSSFDALGALEQWVERGIAPERIVATKYVDDDRARPVLRTMPLCPFPTQARYVGAGEVRDATSWSCDGNADLLTVGPNGVEAGLTRDLREPGGP